MWTTYRTPNSPTGCHFYIAKYGIRIQQASNTLIVWKPGEAHGTSLPDAGPTKETDTKFRQRAIAFVTSKRLEQAWRKLQSNGSLTNKEAMDLAAALEDEDDVKYE